MMPVVALVPLVRDTLREPCSTMPNQNKPTRTSTDTFICSSSLRAYLDPLAPKKLIEPFAREFHSWGVTHKKLLPMLKEEFDTERFGLGYVKCYSFSAVF